MTTVDAYRCESCEALFEEPGGRFYECSRCGQEFSEEDAENRRCPECHVFASKVAESHCPECLSYDPEPKVVAAWRDAAGQLYESEEAEAEWEAGAPTRAAAKERHEAAMANWMEKYRAESRALNAAILPGLRRLVELIDDRAPQLRQVLLWQLAGLERDADERPAAAPSLYFLELAALLAPGSELDALVEFDAGCYGGPKDEWMARMNRRDELARPVREAMAKTLEGTSLYERVADRHYTPGTGLGFPVAEVVVGLLAALDRRSER